MSHRRDVELPQASSETIIAPPLLDEHVHVRMSHMYIITNLYAV